MLERIRKQLEDSGIENAQRESEWIVEAATGLDRSVIVAGGMQLTDEQQREALALAQRRADGEPLQYVTGIAGFRYLELKVGPGVFIPRPETELVVERALGVLPEGGTVVEIGTGSGAMALSLAQERPDARVWATEYSDEALSWAIRNRDELGLEVEMVKGDMFEGLPGDLKGQIDVIVSNPPYIPQGFTLAKEIIDFEPHVALFADDSGLGFIERMIEDAREWLASPGRIIMEISEAQRDAVSALLTSAGFSDVTVVKDLTERPRIAEGTWS